MLESYLIDSDDVDRAIQQARGRAGMIPVPFGPFRVFSLTTIGSAVWNLPLIGSGWLLGTQYHVIEEHIDTANNIITCSSEHPSRYSSCVDSTAVADPSIGAPTMRRTLMVLPWSF